MHDRGDFAVLLIPGIGELRQASSIGGGEEACGSDPDREHVAAPTGDSEVDMQPTAIGIGDKEVFAIMLAPEITSEIPCPAGAQVAFGQLGRQRLTK